MGNNLLPGVYSYYLSYMLSTCKCGDAFVVLNLKLPWYAFCFNKDRVVKIERKRNNQTFVKGFGSRIRSLRWNVGIPTSPVVGIPTVVYLIK